MIKRQLKAALTRILTVCLLIAVNHGVSAEGMPAGDTTAINHNNAKDSLYVGDSEFTYAGQKRYTLLGHNPLRNSDIKLLPTIALGGVVTTLFILQHIAQMNTIWSETSDFKIMEDGMYGLNADKGGHVFGAYYTSYFWSEAFYTIGMDYELSTVLGGVMGMGYLTYVEVLDGFGKDWGFSPSDFYADILGTVLYLGQHYVPYLQNFTPKFTYIPAPWHGNKHRIPSKIFIDDYSSHTLWLSINVNNILPDNLEKYWPDWLELSVGYAARDLCQGCPPGYAALHKIDGGEVYGNREYIISLDYNLVKLLPDGCNLWNWFKQSLNYLKFPAPALVFGDKAPRFQLLYPFKICL